MELNIGTKKTKLSKDKIISGLAHAWQRSYKIMLLFCFVAVCFFGWSIWQKSLSGNSWSEEKKQEYLSSQNTGVVFNQKNYEKVLADIELRKKESDVAAKEVKDIFKPY
jgi:hypothetical protein